MLEQRNKRKEKTKNCDILVKSTMERRWLERHGKSKYIDFSDKYNL